MRKLLTPAKSNPKTAKGGEGFEAVILHLSPADVAITGKSVCPWSTPGCRAACLATSGRSQVKGSLKARNLKRYPIHRARMRKTRFFLRDRRAFLAQLNRELTNLTIRAARKGLRPVARLNGTSDIPWESFGIMERHPDVTFYDYTKSKRRAQAFRERRLPENYHLTLSRSEADPFAGFVRSVTRKGGNVAVVFAGDTLPETYDGARVINGVESDWRFTDPPGVVVGLLAKGRAKSDRSGFVVHN